MEKNPCHIPSVRGISYKYFFDEFLQSNSPCIIENVAQNWESWKLWTFKNKPCFDYLSTKYGNSEVTIYKCNEKFYNSQQTFEMKLEDFITYWKDYIKSDYPEELPLYYLKDWHLKNQSEDDCFYTTPIYFSSDWLNEYLTICEMDDYRFVYMGPKGSWTPFHRDVFASYSWSVNVCGIKKWILFPAGEEKKLLDELGNLPYNIINIPRNVKYFEIIQSPGDAIFVPSGWYHQVFNLEDTISINHNWLNGCNIKMMWYAMENELSAVIKEISDCENMENFPEQCQLILKSTFGMNFEDFFKFLDFIAIRRIVEMNAQGISNSAFVIFDLRALKDVLQLLSTHEEMKKSPKLRELNECVSKTITRIIHEIQLYEDSHT